MSWRHLDEGDVRVRPSRRGSRPRSKDRPAHADADAGLVVAVDRGRYTVVMGTADGAAPHDSERVVTAMRARELSRRAVVVGDRVEVVGDRTGGPDTLARIVRIQPRRTTLRRSADDTDPVERIVVANATRLAIVVSLSQPAPRPRFVDRCLVAAYDGGLDPLLVLTKSDLHPPDDMLAQYGPLDVPAVVTGRDRPDGGIPALREHLVGETTVLVGPSGVGKSTLVNAVIPDAGRTTGGVNTVTGRGRHTSTSVVALRLGSAPGWVVDTPGVRSFGLAHVRVEDIVGYFPELAAGTEDCPRGCTHDEPDCGLDDFVESGGAGSAGPARLDSVRRLLRARGDGGRLD